MWCTVMTVLHNLTWTYWQHSSLMCSLFLSKWTLYSCFIWTLCLVSEKWKVVFYNSRMNVLQVNFIVSNHHVDNSNSCSSLGAFLCPLREVDVESTCSRRSSHTISYLLVSRKIWTKDATVSRLRFGCTRSPASLYNSPWFMTWSIILALISSVTLALALLWAHHAF